MPARKTTRKKTSRNSRSRPTKSRTVARKQDEYDVLDRKLDSFLGVDYSKKFDHVYMKIDVDGGEVNVLNGAKGFVRNSGKITLLIEDFVDNSIVKFLEKDFQFVEKPSPYNSFWIKK